MTSKRKLNFDNRLNLKSGGKNPGEKKLSWVFYFIT